jgi:hypothetical protein
MQTVLDRLVQADPGTDGGKGMRQHRYHWICLKGQGREAAAVS